MRKSVGKKFETPPIVAGRRGGGGGIQGGNYHERVGLKTDSQHSLHYRCILQIMKEFCVARNPF
jgi:hypothetical protein